MYFNDFSRTARPTAPIVCPNCHSSEREDRRTDERIYEEAARDVQRLRHEGRISEALEVLTALYAVRIGNFLKARWLCLEHFHLDR